jgi:CubicO group peptidase (beta-lactamase class C family)
MLRRGRWGERQVLSERWIDQATTPCAIKPEYGYLWWLNTDRMLYPSLPASSFFAHGAGRNLIWVEPERDLVVVARWIEPDDSDAFARRVLAAVVA